MVFLWVTITSLTDEIISNARKTMGKLVDNIISLKIDELKHMNFHKINYSDLKSLMIMHYSI